MTCVEFWVWFGSGALVVPLLAFLKQLPRVGVVVEAWAWLLAPVLSLILPRIAAIAVPYCDTLDPKLWALIYAALAYLVSQLLYWCAKKWGINV